MCRVRERYRRAGETMTRIWPEAVHHYSTCTTEYMLFFAKVQGSLLSNEPHTHSPSRHTAETRWSGYRYTLIESTVDRHTRDFNLHTSRYCKAVLLPPLAFAIQRSNAYYRPFSGRQPLQPAKGALQALPAFLRKPPRKGAATAAAVRAAVATD